MALRPQGYPWFAFDLEKILERLLKLGNYFKASQQQKTQISSLN